MSYLTFCPRKCFIHSTLSKYGLMGLSDGELENQRGIDSAF